MEYYVLLAFVLLGAAVVYGTYLTVTTIADKVLQKQKWDSRNKNIEIVLPLRLQAYERMSIFLERISPSSLLLRLTPNAGTALELQHILLSEIREEYNHNVAQQIYMSNNAWEQIGYAMNETIADINNAAAEVSPDAPAQDLGKKIFSLVIAREVQPTTHALTALKAEIREVF